MLGIFIEGGSHARDQNWPLCGKERFSGSRGRRTGHGGPAQTVAPARGAELLRLAAALLDRHRSLFGLALLGTRIDRARSSSANAAGPLCEAVCAAREERRPRCRGDL